MRAGALVEGAGGISVSFGGAMFRMRGGMVPSVRGIVPEDAARLTMVSLMMLT